MMQKPGDRRLSDRDLFLLQSVLEFGQRDVRLLRYQLPHQILVRRQREIFVAAEYGFAIHAGLLPAGSLNHIRAAMGIPDSAFPGNALMMQSSCGICLSSESCRHTAGSNKEGMTTNA